MEAETRPNYLFVFIILAVFTVTETLVSYVQQDAIKFPLLILSTIFKVTLVLLYFMHLKFDSKVFSYLFIAGCILSIPLILILTLVMPSIV
jgi:cytochrome c oxidase subunit 4